MKFWHWLFGPGAQGASALATSAGVLVALGLGIFELISRGRAARRRQADQVGAWMARPEPKRYSSMPDLSAVFMTPVIINNSSTQPVYDLAAVLVFRQGGGPQTGAEWVKLGEAENMISLIPQVPPGRFRQMLREPDNAPMGTGGVLLVEITFTDQAGNRWQRAANGKLRRLRTDAIDTYGLSRPPRLADLGEEANRS